MRTTLLGTVLTACSSACIPAQAGNETIFVGTSMWELVDNHAFVESGTGTILSSSFTYMTHTLGDAVWNQAGTRLFAMRTTGELNLAQWNGSAPTWSATSVGPSSCRGIGLDEGRQRIWALMGPTYRELQCFDIDPTSATYATVIAQTTHLDAVVREEWAISISGNFAAVPHAITGSGILDIVDLDPNSATYLQTIQSSYLLGGQAGGLALVMDVKFSIDERYVYLLKTGTAGTTLAVWDLWQQAWLDFSPAPFIQDLTIPFWAADEMDVSLDRSFAVAVGKGNSGVGWAARIDFDYTSPSSTTITEYTGHSLPYAAGVAISPEQSRVAITTMTTLNVLGSNLLIIDADTSALIHNVPLPTMRNVWTVAWQQNSPTATYTPYGAGCAGSLGVPTLTAAAGSRPALGTTFTATVDNLPANLAVMSSGLAQTGPVNLGPLGMPGCSQYADALILDLISGSQGQASWSLNVPNTTSLFGVHFYNQAYPLDPGANAFGLTASNAATGFVGY